MKKVLMCYHSSQFGGVEKHILDIISGLSGEFEIFVACPEGPLVKDYLKAGAAWHINLSPKFEADFSYALAIRKIVEAEKIDIVHAHELLTGSLAMFGAWLARCPKRIYHVHTSFTEWRYSSLKKYPALVINGIVNFLDANIFATDVIALTESVKNVKVERERINPDKIRIIPNGIHADQFKYDSYGRNELREKLGISENQVVIGNIARFSEEKGQTVLLDAFKLLVEDKESTQGFVLVLAGSGAMQNEIQMKAEEYGIDDRVHFLGNFQEEEKAKILSSFDCFVFPSYAEGFGIALVEAMSVGIPSIVSSLDVLRDVGESAVLYFKTGDSIDLKNKIQNLMASPHEIKFLTQAGSERSQEFSIQKFWQAYSNLYNS